MVLDSGLVLVERVPEAQQDLVDIREARCLLERRLRQLAKIGRAHV